MKKEDYEKILKQLEEIEDKVDKLKKGIEQDLTITISKSEYDYLKSLENSKTEEKQLWSPVPAPFPSCPYPTGPWWITNPLPLTYITTSNEGTSTPNIKC